MLRTNDNWEKLVAAALKKQELWELFHAQSRSPSIRSEASDSDYSSSSGSSYRFHDLPFDFSSRWQDEIYVSQDLTKLVSVSDFSPAIDVEQVAVSSSEILGTGTFGSAYKVHMLNGVTIVVKALRAVGIPESKFNRNMVIVGNVQHENVLALRAYCSSAGQRLMLYDHNSKGSVYSLLHGRTGVDRAEIDWETRLKIAVGAARGLAEIHAQNGGTLVHGNIKASNIFLDSQGYGIISDLGFATMISINVKRPVWCYAPEVKNTRDVSQASDVYSFGILLLELLTRKSPVHVPGGPRAIDLVKFVTSIRRKIWASKVYDVELLKQTDKKEQMVKMLQIGIGCVAKSVKQRLKMSEVVRMLEDIGIANNPAASSSSSPLAPSSVQSDLVFFEGDNFQMFSLDDLLRSSAELLGKGTFGTCYKASLKTGNIVTAVKRIKDVTAGSKEFQQQMELIGRIKHENVAELRAYYYSKDENLLVYDYYDQGSVSELLHGSFRSPKQPLDLDTRLRIAVGAARGLTHIHTQASGTLVHGNVKSSNLFIKGHRYGLVSDIGLAKLTSQIQVSGFRASFFLRTTGFHTSGSSGYNAPEVHSSTSKLSQASDVYSFGVVLLELLTGKEPLKSINVDDHDVSIVDWVQCATSQDDWTSDIFDLELLRAECDEETLVQLLHISMGCIVTSPERRHKMHQVVDMLEEVSNLDQPSKSWDQPSEESQNQRSEESQDQPSTESWDQPSEESWDQLSEESQDHPFEESRDQLSEESQDQPFEESWDQLSEESQDQPSEEPWDQPFAKTRLVDILPTFMP